MAYFPIGFECHFDAMVFQNSLYWLRGPANVWNSAVPPFGFYNGSLYFKGGFGLLACKMKRLGYPLDCNADITHCFSLIWSDFVVGIFATDPSTT